MERGAHINSHTNSPKKSENDQTYGSNGSDRSKMADVGLSKRYKAGSEQQTATFTSYRF